MQPDNTTSATAGSAAADAAASNLFEAYCAAHFDWERQPTPDTFKRKWAAYRDFERAFIGGA